MTALRLFLFLTLVTGLLYPLAVTGISMVIFPQQSSGQMLTQQDKPVGSALIGQSFSQAHYFWGRPSAGDHEGAGATNLSPVHPDLAVTASSVRDSLNVDTNEVLPADLLSSSGSGLDPHISPASAALQVERVAQARGIEPVLLQKLLENRTEHPTFGLLGEPRVNVLLLNLDLDKEYPRS